MTTYDWKLYNPKYNQLSTNVIISDCTVMSQPNEIFVQVLYLNSLVPRYLISNFGRMWDAQTCRFGNQSPDKDGYLRVNIKPDGFHFKTVKVHRLMLMSFYPLNDINDYKIMVSNHKNGIKDCNNLENLEWATNLENTRHAWNTGLTNHYGENHPLSVYSDETIHEVCSMIDKGFSNSQICDYYNLTDTKDRMRFMATIGGIRQGKVHLQISSQYQFMNNSKKMSPNELFIHLACQLLSNGKIYTFKELADILNVPNDERVQFVNFISALVSRDTGLEISRLYPELKRPLKFKSDNDYLY